MGSAHHRRARSHGGGHEVALILAHQHARDVRADEADEADDAGEGHGGGRDERDHDEHDDPQAGGVDAEGGGAGVAKPQRRQPPRQRSQDGQRHHEHTR